MPLSPPASSVGAYLIGAPPSAPHSNSNEAGRTKHPSFASADLLSHISTMSATDQTAHSEISAHCESNSSELCVLAPTAISDHCAIQTAHKTKANKVSKMRDTVLLCGSTMGQRVDRLGPRPTHNVPAFFFLSFSRSLTARL